MQITRAADYAVRVIVHLSSLPQGSRLQRSELVRLSEAPESFLSKVLQRLVWSGLITSRRGGRGGFELAISPKQISVLRIVEAIDGPIHLNFCAPGAIGCDRSPECAVHPVWIEAQTALVKVLGAANIAKLGKAQTGKRDRNRRVDRLPKTAADGKPQ